MSAMSEKQTLEGILRAHTTRLLMRLSYSGRMTYRLNLYSNAKLVSTELLDTSLHEAKGIACSALDLGSGQRAELLNNSGVIMFQRWAVL
jgi:hypothetical protein